MTTCSECLNALSSARVADMGPGSAVAIHCATCPVCSRVADEVRFAEYRLAASLNEARPGTSSEEMAAVAIDGSERLRRQRVGRWIRVGLGVAALAVFAVFWETMRGAREDRNLLTETITLRCVTASQAAQLITPYLRADGSVVYHADELRTVTIRATSEQMASAKMVIDGLESGVCKIPSGSTPAPTADPAPTTSVATPGKD